MGRDPKRDYVHEGRRLPSVTEVLKLGGIDEYAGVDQEILRVAAMHGHRVHWITEQLDYGNIISLQQVPLYYRGYAQAYCRFLVRERFEVLLTERVVVSPKHRFAGRLDRAGRFRRRRRKSILDIKRVQTVEGKESWGLQTAAYDIALREWLMPMEEPFDRYTLCLFANGSYQMQRWPSERDGKEFLRLARYVNKEIDAGRVSLPEPHMTDDTLELEPIDLFEEAA